MLCIEGLPQDLVLGFQSVGSHDVICHMFVDFGDRETTQHGSAKQRATTSSWRREIPTVAEAWDSEMALEELPMAPQVALTPVPLAPMVPVAPPQEVTGTPRAPEWIEPMEPVPWERWEARMEGME